MPKRYHNIIGIALIFLVTTPLLSGCHDEARLKQRLDGPRMRLPVEPNTPDTPPAAALLDTVAPYKQEALYPSSDQVSWQMPTLHVNDTFDVTYRVPETWTITSLSRAENAEQSITARATKTDLNDSSISLVTYAAQLADGNKLFSYTTTDGHVVYVTRRIVALAPSDPQTPREVFHTAVTAVNGKIIKLDVRYNAELNWRFNQLANALTGTIQVRPREA